MIKGYSEVMRDIPGENTPENVQVIIDETTRLSALVDDILDLSRIRAGARPVEYERIDLTEALNETLLRYDALVRHKGYRIELKSDRDVWVYGDRGMLLQVLYNLINNAINYTGDDHLVTVTQSVTEDTVRISVTDTGEGIDGDQIPLIWDRYYKVDKTHKRAMIGTGLGLSIVKGILELHEASYGVESVKGQGSTFWFALPILREETEKNSEEA
jgi:signal transduction histidine kinase